MDKNNPPLFTISGFMHRFYEDLHKHKNNKACYEALALELEEKHGVSLFTTYNAFKIAKSRLLNKKGKRDKNGKRIYSRHDKPRIV